MAWLTREQLLRILYDHVPDKSKVLLNKKVTTVDHSDIGVVARCEDGSEYNGSMIAGADGIHSTIRGEMWKHMEEDRKWKKKAKKDRKGMFLPSTGVHIIGEVCRPNVIGSYGG